ncbi:M20 aminoacylase family protein [Brenneria populi]|uniref:M20 aminoacylase family protein n=1 Tax=Brenneria populi TaxID=1505588 RepID=A0ABU6JMP4_9GAMM|nr:M20 aminoacylase family protein [Brenneria populi Li et al. 2015]
MNNTLFDEIRGYLPELIAIRQDIHQHPEAAFEEERTSEIVARTLESWGIEVARGLAGTGLVGTIVGNRPGTRRIGLRADMDALNMEETTGLPYSSAYPGKMHACGHDGHTAMLLGAARYLAANPDFAGTVHLIFQPAEEEGGGGRVMIEEGLFDRFPCDAVYGLHNEPGLPAGRFGIRPGAMLASVDTWTVSFKGTGGHGAVPHRAVDPSMPLAHFLLGLQTIIGRNVPARETAVISAGYISAGHARSANVIPSEIVVRGTARTYEASVRDTLERRLSELALSLAAAHQCRAEVCYQRGYPALVNAKRQTEIAAAAAAHTAGAENVDADYPPITAGEDFAYMLKAKPGAFMLIGNGVGPDGSYHHVHTPLFDFNDEILPFGIGYWINIVRLELGAE